MCKRFSHFDYSDTRNTRIEEVTLLHVYNSVSEIIQPDVVIT